MTNDRPKRDTMSLEEATISNMWQIAALVEAPGGKGLCAYQELYSIIAEFRRKNPRATILETAFPEPYLFTEPENKIIHDILAAPNKTGLTSYESLSLLDQLERAVEM